MKKSSLTTAVLAGLAGLVGFAGSSSAVELNPDGTGQVLIYPYYTVRAGQQTYISVVNSTNVAQSVKVRFLEGYASKEVLDFNVYLSPYDVWTGTVFKLSDAGLSGDGAAIGTTDRSCTQPDFQGLPTTSGGMHYQAFSNLYYADTTGTYDHDKGPQGLDRTNEGYVELIAMGDIGNANGTADAVTHVQQTDASGAVIPGQGTPSCAANLNTGANVDLSTDFPSGGLFGSGAIINVGQGTFYSYNADAIDGFTKTNLFSSSGSLLPSLLSANDGPLTSTVTSHVFNKGALITATFAAPANAIDAVSAVFDSSALLNQWLAGGDVDAGTDWVVTFPTKRFYVNNQYVGGTARAPFVEALDQVHDGASCVAIGLTTFDREEGQPSILQQGPIFSPAPIIHTDVPSLCHEVNVISISDPDSPISILGSQYENTDGGMGLAVNVPNFGNTGWMRINLYSNPLSPETHVMQSADATPVIFNGLPATGFEAVRYLNHNAQPGMLSNYSGAFRHRAERDITS